jgi:hypothetical protein
MSVVMVAMERHDMMIEKTVAKLSFAAPRRLCIWMSAVGTDSHTISTTSHPFRSALEVIGAPTLAVSLRMRHVSTNGFMPVRTKRTSSMRRRLPWCRWLTSTMIIWRDMLSITVASSAEARPMLPSW